MKFDSIADGHKAALVDMGIVVQDKKERDEPQCPAFFAGAHDKYRELKFMQRDNGDSITLYSRDAIGWRDLIAYKEATGNEISLLETEVIMGIDAIFEGREDG